VSEGAARRWSSLLLGQKFEGIWHTSVVVEWHHRKSEFWYGGRLFESEPGRTPFGEPVERKFVGHTYKLREEVWNHITRHLVAMFTPENYDVLTHNCNHFSDKLSMFLQNEHIPDEIIAQPQLVMSTFTARLLRPLLNRWLGSLNSKESRSTDGGDAAKEMWEAVGPGVLVNLQRRRAGNRQLAKSWTSQPIVVGCIAWICGVAPLWKGVCRVP